MGTADPEPQGTRSANPKLIVADADPQTTWLLAAALEPSGYAVLQAHGAAEAIRIAQGHAIDAALINVRMPDGDGFGVLQALRERDEHLVAIMMTDHGILDEARRAMLLGAYDYVTKPFDVSELRAVLDAGLSESADAREAVAAAALTSPDQ